MALDEFYEKYINLIFIKLTDELAKIEEIKSIQN